MSPSRYAFSLTSRACSNSRNANRSFAYGLRQPFATSTHLYPRANRSAQIKIENPPPRKNSPALQHNTEPKSGLMRGPGSEEAKQATTGAPKTIETSDTASVVLKGPARRYAYPEKVLVWNGGLWRNAFIGFTNVASLTWMGWGLAIWAPSYMMIPDLNGWYTIPAILVSVLPWLYTRWTTSPYVATVRIELPPKARTSKQALWEFAAKMPPETPLEFTTVGRIGLQRTITTSLGKLSPREPKIGIGIGNIHRADEENSTALEKYKRWAQGSTLYVGGDEGSVKSNAPGIWCAIMDHIIQGPTRQGRRILLPRTPITAGKTQ